MTRRPASSQVGSGPVASVITPVRRRMDGGERRNRIVDDTHRRARRIRRRSLPRPDARRREAEREAPPRNRHSGPENPIYLPPRKRESTMRGISAFGGLLFINLATHPPRRQGRAPLRRKMIGSETDRSSFTKYTTLLFGDRQSAAARREPDAPTGAPYGCRAGRPRARYRSTIRNLVYARDGLVRRT